ncbi:endonuclease [Fragilaria crotonensis]|nr:endonuclease [Fragilaria crotonensis]
MELGRDGKWIEILSLYHAKKECFNHVNDATVMSQLGRIRHVRNDDPSLESFLYHLHIKLQGRGITWMGETRQVANIVHALGKIGMPQTLDSSAMKIMRLVGDSETAEWMFEYGNPQEIANCIWAYGTLEIESPTLFRLLDQRADWLAGNLTSQGLANCIWACGKLGIISPSLFMLLDQRAEWLFENGTAQEIINCVWACGKLGIESPNLLRLLDENAERLVDGGTPQDLSNSVWACAKLGIKSFNMLRLLDHRAEWLFEKGSPQNFVNCVWACGSLGVESPSLFRLLDQRAERIVRHLTPQGLANCLWSCGKLGIKSPNLLHLFDERAEWLVKTGTPQEIANCAWALSVLGSQSLRFFASLDRCLNKFLDDSNSQNLCNVCYAIGILDLQQTSMLPKVWNALVERTTGDLPVDELIQILYVEACASAYGIELASPSPGLRRQLDQLSLPNTSSDFEQEISNALDDIGFSHQQGLSPFQFSPGLLAIDMACPDRMIAIEYDGPNHYVSIPGDSEKRVENGPTKAKRRLLQQLGWVVINLNWMEAYRNQMSSEWVRAKLTEAGIAL